MVNYSLPLFQNVAALWDTVKCEKMVKHTACDGLGTRYPFKGYIGSHYGPVRYNGGCVKTDEKGKEEWFQGEYFPLPIIAKGFKIIHVPTWGFRIIRENQG